MPQDKKHVNGVGIDFGTTNSSVALAAQDAPVRIATFSPGASVSFRSVLYFESLPSPGGAKRTHSLSGPAAIERYLDAEEKGRLIQSLKSHLPSRMLTGTEVFGRSHRIEELISRILGDLRKQAERQFEQPIRSAMVGRPVRFVGAETAEDDDYAVARLRTAFTLAGFEDVDFELEPVAAAYSYEATLDHDELILIGDFGGGTSDFSLLRVGPQVRRRGRTPQDLLGNGGVGLASMRASCASSSLRRSAPTPKRVPSTRSSPPYPPGSTPTWNAGIIFPFCEPTTSARFSKARALALWSRRRSKPSSPSSTRIWAIGSIMPCSR
jgi:hypothetical chaperone protein